MLRLRNFMQVACMATVVLTAFGCSQEEFETNRRKGDITITASFEGAGGANTRTKVDEQYRVLWEETDALALFDTKGTKIKLNHSSGTGPPPPSKVSRAQETAARSRSPSIPIRKKA